MIKSATRDFNTPFELKELEDFYEQHKNELGTAKRGTLNSIEKVLANLPPGITTTLHLCCGYPDK